MLVEVLFAIPQPDQEKDSTYRLTSGASLPPRLIARPQFQDESGVEDEGDGGRVS
jgi:hypothetical protein